MAQLKVTKATVNYRKGTRDRHCGNCAMYHDHTCDLVAGPIKPSMTCDRWTAKKKVKGGKGR